MIFFQSLDVVRQEGYATHHVHASYVHLYFPASPEPALRFVENALLLKRASKGIK
jgi:cobyrinic acid a,c-diamide synthase